MFTKEEEKALRLGFWAEFKRFSQKKRKKLNLPASWIMNDTGIKQLKLKFDFVDNKAIAGIDVQTRNLDKRIEIFGKLERLKTILENKLGTPLIWDVDHKLASGISISRAYVELKDVSIYSKDDWPKIFDFFYSNMIKIEEVFTGYKDYLKYGERNE